jgi:hypothetical protein
MYVECVHTFIGNRAGVSSCKLRAMFLCKVTRGQPFTTKTNMTQQQVDAALNQGYSSVQGEVGVDLQYDELVVYEEAAAIPSYLIVYKF